MVSTAYNENDPVLRYLETGERPSLQDFFDSASRENLEALEKHNEMLEAMLSDVQKSRAREIFNDLLNDKYYHFDVGLDYVNPDAHEEGVRLYHLAILLVLSNNKKE